MALIEEQVLKLLFYVLPMYFANSCAMLFGGKTPMDFGAKFFDGRPLLGKGKTFKGFFFGICAGTLAGAIIFSIAPNEAALVSGNYLLFGALASIGAIIGDIAGSFLKRRLGFEPGKEFFLLDQLDFVLGGMAFASVLYLPSIEGIIAVLIATLLVHRLANFIAFKMNLKKVPW